MKIDEGMGKKKNRQQQQKMSPERFLREKVRSLPIGKCYISALFDTTKAGIVVVTREHAGGKKTMGHFYVDAMCLGVKDCFYRVRMDESESDWMIEQLKEAGAEEITYEEAHNRIWGAVAFAEEAGIRPCKEFALAQYILEEDTDDIPLIEYDYGRDGKHCLFAKSRLEASCFVPAMRQHLGDNFEVVIDAGDSYDDDDYDDDYDVDDDYDEDDEGPLGFMDDNDGDVKRWKQPYTYRHPDYPTQLALENPQLPQMLGGENWLTPSETAEILSLPHDSLRRDLEQIIYWTLGQEYTTNIEKKDVNYVMIDATMLLGEVGNEESLKAVLEVLRQDSDFMDKYYGDTNSYSLVPTICKLGYGHLDMLAAFMKEKGLDIWCKSHVTEAVAAMHRNEEKAAETVEWFRNLLQSIIDDFPNATYVDASLLALITSDIMDMNARELLPLIEQLYNLKFVDESISGKYSEVERDFGKWTEFLPFASDINDRFAKLKQMFG